MNKFIIVIVMLFLSPFIAHATVQVPDLLLHNGDQMELLHPLDIPMVKGIERISSDLESVKKTSDREDAKLLGTEACTRNYIGTWEIKEDKLFLNNVIGIYRKTSTEPIFANWVIGILGIPIGEKIESENAIEVYEQVMLFHIKNGVIAKSVIINNVIEKKKPGTKKNP